MKAEIGEDHFIHIIAETPTETLALRYLTDVDKTKICNSCQTFNWPIMIETIPKED